MERRAPQRARQALVWGLLVGLLVAGCDSSRRGRYEPEDRDTWQQPDRVIEALGIEPGSIVADLGSGAGYFTGRLASAVGRQGRVYAVDVDPVAHEELAARMREEGHDNVERVLATEHDSGLAANSLDLVFSANTYHHLPQRESYFRSLRTALAPGGRVAIIEYRTDAGLLQRFLGHATDAQDIRREMLAAGYALAADHEFLERQNFLVFRPRP